MGSLSSSPVASSSEGAKSLEKIPNLIISDETHPIPPLGEYENGLPKGLRGRRLEEFEGLVGGAGGDSTDPRPERLLVRTCLDMLS